MIAQALIERGMLGSLVSGISAAFGYVSDEFLDHPYLLIGLAVVLALLLKKRR